MKAKHTLGQWNAKKEHFNWTVSVEETGKTIAQINCINGETDDEQEEANAKLVASAPELLQMVYDLKKCVERLTNDNLELHQEDKDKEAQWIGEAHELLHKINPNYYQNANE